MTGSPVLAVDIGTTTLSFALCVIERTGCANTGRTLETYTCINPQRIYGSDIVLRLSCALKGMQKKLQQVLYDAIVRGMHILCQRCECAVTDITEIAVAANTALVHLLLGFDCNGLSQFPFTPVSVDIQYSSICGIPVTVLPCISAFIGGDIVAGIYFSGMFQANRQQNKAVLLVDIGTNAEIVLAYNDTLWCTSAAAGPAFEANPVALGSEVVDIVAGLLETKCIDYTGLLSEAYFTKGFATAKGYFTQNHIREVQLAKAAVYAGMSLLCRKALIPLSEIHTVYVAGNFGTHLSFAHALRIGLLPIEFEKKLQAIGNSALEGVKKFLCEKENALQEFEYIRQNAQEMVLANDENFNTLFIDSMNF